MKRDTVGAISQELLQKELETTDPIEQMREQLSEYDQNIFECIKNAYAAFPNDFYIVVITKKEKLMENVIRHYFLSRSTCPTPDYDQTIYRYDRKKEEISFLWTIPSKHACMIIKERAVEIVANDPSQKDLVMFVLQFADGSLYKKALELNNESPSA